MDTRSIPNPATAKAPVRRWFFRCKDCLTVAVTEQELRLVEVQIGPAQYTWRYAECGACGGDIEFMGRTSAHTACIAKTEWRCACDGRCTGAIGPSCDCQCGGENHGTGRVVEVEVQHQGLPKLKITPDARAVAEEFRAACRDFETAWNEKFGALARHKNWLQGSAYARLQRGYDLRTAFRKARVNRTPKGRLKAIAKVKEVLLAA